MKNLEREVIELNQLLRSFMPALHQLEDRVRDAELDAVSSNSEREALGRELGQFKDRTDKMLEDISTTLRAFKTEQGTQGNDISGIVKREASLGLKVWDVAKLLISAGLGILGAKIFGGLK